MTTPLAPLFQTLALKCEVIQAPRPPGGLPGGGVGCGGGGGGVGRPAPHPVCPYGTVWNPALQACVTTGGPTISGNFPGSSSGTSTTTTVTEGQPAETQGEGPIYVNTQNTVNVADNSAANAVQNVAYAVNAGITAAVQNASDIAQYTASQVQDGIGTLVNTIDQGLTEASNSIAGVAGGLVSDINNTLGGIGSTIGNDLFNAINPVSIGLAQIIDVISRQIGGLAGQIGDAVARVIPLIVAAIQGAISPSQAAIAAIGTEITAALGQLTQATGQVSGGLGSIDATLGRILQNWELYNTGFVEAQTGYPDDGTLHKDLASIWQTLAGLVITLAGTAQYRASDILSGPCNSVFLQGLIDSPYKFGDEDTGFIKSMGIALWSFAMNLAKVLPALAKINDVAGQLVNQDCPSGLLTPAELVQAEMRGFLAHTQTIAEAAKGNIDPTRYKTLQDLAVHQLSPQQLVEGLYRGYIGQGDFAGALTAQGWTAGQQAILQGLFVEQIRPATFNSLNELRQRGLISDQDYRNVLKTQGFDDGQQTLLSKIVFRPSNLGEATDGAASFDALNGIGASGSFGIPEYAQAAAAAEGLDPDATKDRWLAHWNLGAIGEWIQLYFRGLATQQQLQAVFVKNAVPGEIQSRLIDGARPLIQFRTITRLVGLKLMSPQEGLIQLQRHGYSQQDAQTLINYAIATAKVPAAQRAAQTHAISIGIAKEEYIDGSISAAQFYDVLIAHGFTPDGANTEISVINAHEAMLSRKAAAQLIVDEYGAGLISETVALAQLAAQGLTVAELAKYAHKIRAFRTKNAKLPTEAELLKMLKAGIITDQTYKTTLIAEGYAPVWADAFFQLGTSPSPAVSGAGTPAPAPTPVGP